MAATDNSMEYTERLLSILLIEKSLSADMRIRVEAHAMAVIENLSIDAGNFLHNLDAERHTEDEVKAAITHFPSAISHLNDDDQLPCKAVDWYRRNYIPFIALLAEEGAKLNVGGEGQRGGLRVEDYERNNLLQYLALYVDGLCIDVFNRLRKSDLLKKEDIRQYDLMYRASTEAFEYFVDWDPKALKEYQYNGEPILHAHLCAVMGRFAMTLKAGMKYYPEELGLLFKKNSNGDTGWKVAFDLDGEEKAWKTIEKCFEETHDAKIVERDPMTNLYPFMIAAAGKTSELNTLYYLLRRNPVVLECVGEMDGLDFGVDTKRERES